MRVNNSNMVANAPVRHAGNAIRYTKQGLQKAFCVVFFEATQYTGKGYFMNPNANRLFLYHGRLPETHITEDEERLFQAEPRADIIARKPEYR